jgi:hypothetical protein
LGPTGKNQRLSPPSRSRLSRRPLASVPSTLDLNAADPAPRERQKRFQAGLATKAREKDEAI